MQEIKYDSTVYGGSNMFVTQQNGYGILFLGWRRRIAPDRIASDCNMVCIWKIKSYK